MEEFLLWRLPIRELVPGAILRPEFLESGLPSSSEGLALMGSTAYILIDGDRGSNDERCARAATYTTQRVPN